MPSVRLEQITKAYGDKKALEHVSFTACKGSRTVIIGASGAGKTTILRMIAGFESPDEGRLYFDETDAKDLPASERGIGMIFQDGALFPHSTVFENISYGLHKLGFAGDEIRRMSEETAEKLHIFGLLDRYPASLSAGERQRAGIARALVRKPEVMLLDEPFANLDIRLKEELLEEIISLQEETGMTMIHVTHDQSEALASAQQLIVMDEGKILDSGNPQRIVNDPEDLKAAMFLGTPALNVLSGLSKAGEYAAAVKPEKMHISSDGIACRVISAVPRFSDTILECAYGEDIVRAVTHGREKPGDTVYLTFDSSDLMLFDERTGKRIRKQNE